MQSEFLKTIHNQGRDLGRREELLRMASWIDDEAELERLRTVTDLADLEREVRQIVERRAQGASDA